MEKEFERNRERYEFLSWGQTASRASRSLPPDTGIVHQINLEYLARVVFEKDGVLYPDTLVGTDSHTTMINGLGVLGWGVGGIEAEAAMLGQPISMLIPRVVGFKLTGELREGATATDLVLTVTELLRQPRRGRPVRRVLRPGHREPAARRPGDDRQHVAGVRLDVRDLPHRRGDAALPDVLGPLRPVVERVEAYARPRASGTTSRARSRPTPRRWSSTWARSSRRSPGPSARRTASRSPRPRRRSGSRWRTSSTRPTPRPTRAPEESFPASDPPATNGDSAHDRGAEEGAGAGTGGAQVAERVSTRIPLTLADGTETELDHGHVVIAAITSCTNTSNPSVMIGAGLLARNAVARGLQVKPWVKTSLAPGSKVVMEYYAEAELVEPLEALGFHLVGYGCTTCIGNSGPLPEEVSNVVNAEDLAVVSVLSGNRNFEGRINPDVKMNYLASPPLVVAYALAGTMDVDLLDEPLGQDHDGNDVFLSDIWPSSEEVGRVVEEAVRSEMFQKSYGEVFEGTEEWNALDVPEGDRFAWDGDSTYVRRPTFLEDVPKEPQPQGDIEGARVLALLGDSVTTDHISPAGAIKKGSPAALYLNEHGVEQHEFNSYGARRGNHEVMMRGTFANIRLRNLLAGRDDLVGGLTVKLPEGEVMPIYDAAMAYAESDTPLVVLAGKEYGSGSSRDWAAKGTNLLGVRAVIAQSFERIHRSNLVGMGVLPLQFADGESAESLGLTGEEEFSITGIEDGEAKEVTVRAGEVEFTARVRIDTPKEVQYFQHGGILPFVLRQLLAKGGA